MTPQLVDLNADGFQDMVMATYEGSAFLVEGSKDGWKPPQHIQDSEGSNVRISFYWDRDATEFKSVDRSAKDEANHEDHHMTSIALVDWDNDEDLDLILGAYEGALYLCKNEGTSKEPSFSTTNYQIKADGKHITIDGGLATPRIADWNGDGLFDILCGGAKGGVYYYKNIGSQGKPKFAAAEMLIEKTAGKMTDNSASGANAYYASMMVPTKDGHPTCPGASFHIDVVDYDDDGDLDLLVGGRSYTPSQKRELTKEEKNELQELTDQQAEIQEEMLAMFEGKEQEELQELYETEEFAKLNKEMSKTYSRVSELRPTPQACNYIWLYRNTSKQ